MNLKSICRLSLCLAACVLPASGVAFAQAQAGAKTKQAGAATKQAGAETKPESDVVQFEGGTQLDISNLSDTFELRLPVTVKKGVGELKPCLIAVSEGGLRDQSLMKYFDTRMEKVEGSGDAVRLLIVSVYVKGREQAGGCRKVAADTVQGNAQATKTGTLAHGTYELRVDMQTAPPAETPNLVTLTLKLSPAELDPPATLTVKQEVPFWGEPETTGVLLLSEKSGKKTRLTDIKIQQAGITGGVDQTTTAELTFENPPREIAPGTAASAPVTRAGAFPLGKTNGKLLISSPQLAQPLYVNFEVAARAPRRVILACILFGLILSYLVRTWSLRRIALNEARLKATAAAETLGRELRARPDAEFSRRVTPAHDKLKGISEQTTAEQIKAIVAEADTALTGAVQDFDLRRTAARDLADALRRLTSLDWQLPAALVAPLAASRQALEVADSSIEARNIVAAKAALDTEVSGLPRKLGEPATAWRTQTKSFVNALSEATQLLSPTASAALSAEILSANTLLDNITVTADGATLQQVETMLGELRAARLKVRDSVEQARLLLRGSRAGIAKLQTANLARPHPEMIDDLLKEFNSFQANLASWAEQPEAGGEELLKAILALKTTWRESVLAQVVGNAAAHKKASELFDAGDFVGATEAVFLALPKAPQTHGDLSAIDSAVKHAGSGVAEIFETLKSHGAMTLPGMTIFRTVRDTSTPPRLEALQVLSLRELLWLKLLRFVVAAALITAASWPIFADKVGTPLDLVAIIVWSFGVNFSVDTLLDGQGLKNLPKPG